MGRIAKGKPKVQASSLLETKASKSKSGSVFLGCWEF